MNRLIDLRSRPIWLADLPPEKREALERVVEQHVRALSEGLGAYVMLDTLVDEFWAFAFAVTGAVKGQTSQEALPAPMIWIPHP
ncbi:MAG: hypothetical protein G01um101424_139 [Parcubacteria group bacterium Gr01-1014_24]|nr:MAG: hypothetical protein G01um101424_139 [Parcubacteria group bacterium Gr01-1014_24]